LKRSARQKRSMTGNDDDDDDDDNNNNNKLFLENMI
jgi:hypothetical protein